MKKIISIVVAVVVLLSALSVVSCVTAAPGVSQEEYNNGVSQEEYNKVVAERDEALKKVETLESKIEEASKYVEFLAWWMAGPSPEAPPEAMEKYYAPTLEKVTALGDPEFTKLVEEMDKMGEEMVAKGVPMEEIMMRMMPRGKEMTAYLANKVVEALE